MLKQKIGQKKEREEDDLSSRIYAKTYNNFAELVEKSYSPRFIEVARSKTLDIAELEEEPTKHEKESPQKKETAFTKDGFITDLKKVSRRIEKPKSAPR